MSCDQLRTRRKLAYVSGGSIRIASKFELIINLNKSVVKQLSPLAEWLAHQRLHKQTISDELRHWQTINDRTSPFRYSKSKA